MKTYMAKKGEIKARWRLVDLSGKILGRAATRIATVLMGKHRPEYTPHVDTGDFVVIVNAEKVKVSSPKKLQLHTYERYSGYPSGHKVITMQEVLQKHPDRVIREAVRRMLPKSKLGKAMLSKLKVYAGPDHPHQAQMPEKLEI
jgi:large subunit ribosomal protein L13